ncbi:hypothetical protein LI177_13165 [bacterium 210820-DFI.6.37]|nr:hypothetical protein [bacterium 210820-DFI.6.37]
MKKDGVRKRLAAFMTSLVMVLTLMVPTVGAQAVNAETIDNTDITIVSLKVLQGPDDNSVAIWEYEDENEYEYDFDGLRIEVTYSDGETEVLDYDFDEAELTHLSDNVNVWFYCLMDEAKEGSFDVKIVCEQYDEEGNEVAPVETSFKAEGKKGEFVDSDDSESEVASISVKTLPESCVAYVGTNHVSCEGLSIEILYTDGTTETVAYSEGEFDTPEYSDEAISLKLQAPQIVQGDNTVTVLCGKNSYDESSDEYQFQKICETSFLVTGQKVKMAESIKIVEGNNKVIWVGEKGIPEENAYKVFKDIKVEITYNDGSKETVSPYWGHPEYQVEGLYCYVDGSVPHSVSLGSNQFDVTYYACDDEGYEIVQELTTSFSVIAKEAKKVDSIQINTKPEMTEPYAGLDDGVFLNGLSVKVNYTDKTSEVVEYDRNTFFSGGDLPAAGYDYDYNIGLSDIVHLEAGTNKITVIYTARDLDTYDVIDQKEAAFTVTAKEFKEYDPALETNETISNQVLSRWDAVINANKELLYKFGWEEEACNAIKGIEKAYSRVYLDTDYTATFLTKENQSVSKTNVKDIGQESVLLSDGKLVDINTNQEIMTDVENWYEFLGSIQDALILKKDGTVYYKAGTKLSKITGVSGIIKLSGSNLLDADGILYTLDHADGDTASFKELQKNVKTIYDDFSITKDGKTYLIKGEAVFSVLDKEIDTYKEYIDSQGYYYIVTDQDKNIYSISYQWDYNTPVVKQLSGKFKAFTRCGYITEDENYYDMKGAITDIISGGEDYVYCLKTDGTLYINGKKLMTKVMDYGSNSFSNSPSMITRTDGTIWLFDETMPIDRQRISLPQKVSAAQDNKLESIANLTILVPAQTYTGKALTPAVTVKDGSKTLKNGTDYTVTYSNNVNAGTGKVTITGKGNYTGSVTKTFTIAKAKQTITGASTFNKAYGSKAFSLGAKAKGKLTYKSSNTKVATVSSAGKVTIKGTGTATITVNAAATTNYNKAAAKKVTIKVAPKKMAAPTVKAAKKKMTVSWKKDTKATGYQLTYALNSKFTKSKKSVTISKNKTTKKTISKLKSQKTYYVKTRAYKTVGKTKLYGSYSKVKKIKVK